MNNELEDKIEIDDIDLKIEQRLRSAEKGKQFTDSDIVTYTKKYYSAYDIITLEDLDKIEESNIIAYKMIEKKKIYPLYDIEQQKQKGFGSGVVYFKVKLRESLSNRPIDEKLARETYVRIVQKIMISIENYNTIEDIVAYLREEMDLDSIDLGNVEGKFSKSYYTYSAYKNNLMKYNKKEVEKYVEDIFGKRFLNMCTLSSDTAKRTYTEARLYNEFTQEQYEAYVKMQRQGQKDRLERYQNALSEIEKVKDNAELGSVVDKNRLTMWISLSSDFEKQLNATKEKVNSMIEAVKNAINSDFVAPKYFEVRPNNWSWNDAEKKEEYKEAKEFGGGEPRSILEEYGIKDKKFDKRIPLEYIKRTGGVKAPDIDNLTTKTLKEVFGFNAIVYGNYVNNKERNEHTKHFISALLDLGDILNISVKDFNKIGGLDLNIGSTGCGSFSRAFACYFPTLKAINLTKKDGDGSLAHEFGHYVDNICADGSEQKNKPLYGTTGECSDVLLKQLFKDLDKIWETPNVGKRNITTVKIPKQKKYKYYINSESVEKAIDYIQQKRPNFALFENVFEKDIFRYYGYIAYKFNLEEIEVPVKINMSWYKFVSYKWGRDYMGNPKEMFARMFEMVVQYKLMKADRVSNYLVDTDYIKEIMSLMGIPMEYFPYPQEIELEKMSDWVDKLIDLMKVKFNANNFEFNDGLRVDEYVAITETKNEEEKTQETIEVIADQPNEKETLMQELKDLEMLIELADESDKQALMMDYKDLQSLIELL